MRQLTQQAQVFVTAGRDANRHVSHLTLAPQHALRELEDLHAGFQHLIAGVRGAVRNCNTVTEEGGGLLFTRQHAVDVAVSHVASLHERSGDLANSLFFIPGLFARVNILNR